MKKWIFAALILVVAHISYSQSTLSPELEVIKSSEKLEFKMLIPVSEEQGVLRILDSNNEIILESEVEVLEHSVFKSIDIKALASGAYTITLLANDKVFTQTIKL